MEAKLPTAAPVGVIPGRPDFPYSRWGPGLALVGLLVAFMVPVLISIPVALVEAPADGEDLSSAAQVVLQLAAAIGFVAGPVLIAFFRKGNTMRGALAELGVRRFRRSAWAWMAATVGVYLLFAGIYIALVGEPEQEDVAEGFGAVPFQILLIVIAAPISEEICFRGMLFSGLRERLPTVAAALISGAIFGALHLTTGALVVPPLIAFGFFLALLYERTGSILPGMILHMLNNAVALLGQ
jgi:membrane protease YdiL (CAAX protease family)